MNDQSIDSKLLQAEIVIHNAIKNDVINQAVAKYSYGEPKLLAAQKLLEDVKIKHANQQREYAESVGITVQIEQQYNQLRSDLLTHAKIGRVIFRDDETILRILDIKGRVMQTYTAFLAQAQKFYFNALENKEILENYAKFGITKKELLDCQKVLKSLYSDVATREKEMGEAQQATVARDKALEELMTWVSDFKVFARIALVERPQMLEALGIVEPAE